MINFRIFLCKIVKQRLCTQLFTADCANHFFRLAQGAVPVNLLIQPFCDCVDLTGGEDFINVSKILFERFKEHAVVDASKQVRREVAE